MDFSLTEDQLLLLSSCERWVRERCGIEARLAQARSDPTVRPPLWKELSDLGLAALCIAETDGGLGRPLIDGALIAQTLGRGLLLEPFVDVALASVQTLARCPAGDARNALLARIANDAAIVVPLRDTKHADGTVRSWAPHAGYADALLVWCDERVSVIDGAACERRAYRQLDGSAAAAVVFPLEHATPLARGAAARAAWNAGDDAARIGRIAEGTGLAKTVLDTTAEYLRTRKQFGQPIGRFQALAHRMADLAVLHEQLQSLMLAAAMRMDARTLDAAQVLAHRALRRIAQESIQLHGGIGMTDEYVVAHHVKRMLAIELELGDVETALARFSAAE